MILRFLFLFVLLSTGFSHRASAQASLSAAELSAYDAAQARALQTGDYSQVLVMLRGYCSRGIRTACDKATKVDAVLKYNSAVIQYRQNRDPSQLLPIARENCRLGNTQACNTATNLENVVAQTGANPRSDAINPKPALDRNKSRVIAGNGQSAMNCVTLVTRTREDSKLSGGGRVLANNCGKPVEATWCYVDAECSRESGSTWTIGAGRSYPVSASREVRWAACIGANTASFEKGTAGTRFICNAPTDGPQPQAKPGAPLRSNQAAANGGTSSGRGPNGTTSVAPKPKLAPVDRNSIGSAVWATCRSAFENWVAHSHGQLNIETLRSATLAIDPKTLNAAQVSEWLEHTKKSRAYHLNPNNTFSGGEETRTDALAGDNASICQLEQLLIHISR